ncbi:MAG: hypothetical protein U9N79_09680, partial [Actinomycetota bacterium]|nr:hypothetical protein [Actinomycetota bacterium]
NEWAQEAGLVAGSEQQTADRPEEAAGYQPPATSPEEGGGGGQVLDDADTEEPAAGKVRTWRSAIAVGAIVGLVPLVILVAFAVLVDVPSDLSEAPWYLLGLQPFLTYLDPFIALVIIPGVALASVIVLSVVAWSPSVKPSLRRLALMVLVFLVLAIAALTIIGALWS